MASLTQERFDRRMAVLRDILSEHYLEASEIIPLLYDEEEAGSFEYNNFIYRVNLAKPIDASFRGSQILTISPAGGTSSLVLRLSNPIASGVNNANRVANEVATLHLARAALAESLPKYSKIVPAVYSWAELKTGTDPPEKGFGWIMMEGRPGAQLDEEFKTWTLDDKKAVAEEIAQIFSAIQTHPLPARVGSFGGLTVKDGEIVSAEPTVIPGWPMEDAEESPVLNGWRDNGVRERIDSFMERAVTDLLVGVDGEQRVLSHGDFTPNNMLCNPDTKEVTALFDFDFSFVTHPFHEFYQSFSGGLGGNLRSKTLRQAILSGTFDSRPDGVDADEWELARTWDAALAKHGAIRPCEIKGVDNLMELGAFLLLLCPFQLYHAGVLGRMDAARTAEAMARAEAALVEFLGRHGY